MCTYLAKRGSTYYFRRVIPVELRAALGGKSEFMQSLRTKDREHAKLLSRDKAKETDRLLDDARRRAGMPTLAVRVVNAPALSEFQIEQGRWAAQDEAEREARWDAREPLRKRLLAAFERSTAEITPEEAAMRDLLRDVQAELTIEQERRIARQVADAEQRRGVRPELAAPMPAKSPAEAAQGALAKQADQIPGVMLDPTIVDLWAAERKVTEKGIDTHRGVVRWFYERVGKKPVDQITRKDVLAFKDSLIADNTAANTNMKLSRLQTLLQWAEDNDYREGNPAKGVRVLDTDAARNKRKPFDIRSLNAIFASPVYSERARGAVRP